MRTLLSDHLRWNAIRGATGLLYLFLLLPLFVVVLISFNPTQYPTFPPEGLSLEWYRAFAESDRLQESLINSFIVATGSALVAGVVGLISALGFVRREFRLFGFDRSIEEAAQTLGANELETFFEVTLPTILPGLAAGMLLAFVISFGEFTATQFWVQPDTVTAPIEVYTMVRTSLTPEINAMATILMVVTVVIPLLLDILLGKNLILKSA